MNIERVKDVYEASERSWESTAAQWMTVFDAVQKASDTRLGPIEQAVWNTYRQAQQLRKLVGDLWEESVMESRAQMRREVLAARGGASDGELIEDDRLVS